MLGFKEWLKKVSEEKKANKQEKAKAKEADEKPIIVFINFKGIQNDHQ